MVPTDDHVRFDRVDSVRETDWGLLAELHGERLRVDLVADDIVRVKISRGGVLDESPTFALAVDPLAEHVEFSVERADDVARLRTTALVVSLWLDPFRLDVHRADGSPVVETARDRAGAVLGLRDAQRRLHRAPAVPPGGRDLRPRREVRPPQPQGPGLHTVEHRVFDQAVERDVLCRTEGGDIYIGQVWPGNTAFPDFVTEEARTWWGELNAAHVQSGVAGVWNDMNEPATGRIPPNAMRFGGGLHSHERYHNQCALLMAMGTNWMGDNLSRSNHLWVSMPMAMGLGLSGQPFVGADVGGFHGSSDAELFLRWMQYGTLTPFCRNHSELGNVDQYAWAFGPVVQDLVRDAIRLRYRLLPYIYAAFLQASETGAPVQRPPEAPPSTAGHHPAVMELHLFVPEADGAHRSFLQEDDGLSLDALTGARYRTAFELARSGGRVTLRASVDGDGYPEFARQAFHLVVHGASPDVVHRDGDPVARSRDRFVLPNGGTEFTAGLVV